MTDQEILKKAMEKVWFSIPIGLRLLYQEEDILEDNKYYAIIFSKDFAKAFWGEEWINRDIAIYADRIDYAGKTISDEPSKYVIDLHAVAWQYHLQQMVLSEDPIKYLESFLTP